MAKITFEQDKQTGNVIKVSTSGKTETRTQARVGDIQEMSTKNKIRFGTAIKSQQRRRKGTNQLSSAMQQ